MAKEFAFDNLRREGSTIDRHEISVSPWADIVDSPGDELLSGTAISDDKGGGVSVRHEAAFFEDPMHGVA